MLLLSYPLFTGSLSLPAFNIKYVLSHTPSFLTSPIHLHDLLQLYHPSRQLRSSFDSRMLSKRSGNFERNPASPQVRGFYSRARRLFIGLATFPMGERKRHGRGARGVRGPNFIGSSASKYLLEKPFYRYIVR